MIAFVVASVALGAPTFHLERSGQFTYLKQGNYRLLLEGPKSKQFKLGKSIVIYEDRGQPELVSHGETKKIDLTAKLSEWLKEDELWGGHAVANQMRYMNTGGGGISPYITEISSDGGDTGVAVVTLRFDGPSGEPVSGQLLVKINSAGSIELVRRLSETIPDFYGRAPEQRIYRRGTTRLLLDEGQLWKLDVTGSRGESVAQVKGGNSVGLCNGRYIILDTPAPGGGDNLDGFDLHTLRPFPIFHDTATEYGKYTYISYVPEVGTYLLMTRQLSTSGGSVPLTIHIPDCGQTKMPAGVNKTWRDYAITEDPTEVRIYRAGSGKLVAKLPLPQESSK